MPAPAPTRADLAVTVGLLSAGAQWCNDRYLLWLGRAAAAASPVTIDWKMTPPGAIEHQHALSNPVFQHGMARTLEDGSSELLLVGQSGKRHFSAVMRVTTDGVWLDVADRWSVPLSIARFSLDFQCCGLIASANAELERGEKPESLGFRSDDASLGVLWTVRPHGGSSAAPLLLSLSHDPPTHRLLTASSIGDETLSPRTISYGLEFTFNSSGLRA